MTNSNKTLRIFTVAASLATLFWVTLIHYWLHNHIWDIGYKFSIAYGLIVLFLITGLCVPPCYRHIYRHWLNIAKLINRCINAILLGLVFFIIITPASLLFRLAGKSINASETTDDNTYRIPSRKINANEMEHPY